MKMPERVHLYRGILGVRIVSERKPRFARSQEYVRADLFVAERTRAEHATAAINMRCKALQAMVKHIEIDRLRDMLQAKHNEAQALRERVTALEDQLIDKENQIFDLESVKTDTASATASGAG